MPQTHPTPFARWCLLHRDSFSRYPMRSGSEELSQNCVNFSVQNDIAAYRIAPFIPDRRANFDDEFPHLVASRRICQRAYRNRLFKVEPILNAAWALNCRHDGAMTFKLR